MPLPSNTENGPRRFLRDRAFEMLFGAIESGQLVPGDVLQDEELMDWLGMSRTPIRHALLRLAEAGLIDMNVGRPTTVSALSQERTNRALMVSGMFNTYAIRRMAGALTDDQLGELARHRRALERLVDGGDPAQLARSVGAFFSTLTAACGSSVLDEQVRRVEIELAQFLRPSAAASAIELDRMAASIGAIDDAMQRGDQETALRATIALYEPTRMNFIERFREPEIA
jgi:DNA-binding GntR family transcriptional regulator